MSELTHEPFDTRDTNGIPLGSGGKMLWRLHGEVFECPEKGNCGTCKVKWFGSVSEGYRPCVPCGVRLPADWKGRF